VSRGKRFPRFWGQRLGARRIACHGKRKRGFALDALTRGSELQSLRRWQSLRNFAVREHIQERRLPQGDAQRCFQRVVEHRVARAVGEIGDRSESARTRTKEGGIQRIGPGVRARFGLRCNVDRLPELI
jgi:hypothetical protein